MDDWRNLIKHRYLKRRILHSPKFGRYYWCRSRAQRVCFEIKHLEGYHGFYVQSDTLLLADVFGNFRNMCLKIYELDPEWQTALKKTKVKLGLLTHIHILLMVEKRIKE